jgi:hypothetical protein
VRVRRKKKLLRPSLEKEIVGAERTRMMMPIMDVNVQHTPPAHIAPRHALRRQGSTLRRGGAPAGGRGREKKERSERRELVGGKRADSGKHFAREDERQRPREIRRSGAHSRRGCPSRRLQLQGPTTSSGSSSLADKRQRCLEKLCPYQVIKLICLNACPCAEAWTGGGGLTNARLASRWAHFGLTI